eukprot:TRINITY_DN885_c0_g1_i3.p2 TRINITY_DN885_c0_g1~~TRINITY_DN885_c0_g1_i3.p2  ORF type:complete len:123 (-),score=20.24 TRINITY_DN885_c0_g1_i3:577-945(-)
MQTRDPFLMGTAERLLNQSSMSTQPESPSSTGPVKYAPLPASPHFSASLQNSLTARDALQFDSAADYYSAMETTTQSMQRDSLSPVQKNQPLRPLVRSPPIPHPRPTLGRVEPGRVIPALPR